MDTPTTTTTTTVGYIYSWVDTPMSVALLFGFAGVVFVGIYLLRYWRLRAQNPTK
jgi:hypothetical protein